MKKIFLLFHFLVFSSLWIVASCGVDNLSKKETSTASTTSSLNGGECACNTVYSPVCVDNVSYDNACMAACYSKSKPIQGHCVCSQELVCGDDGKTYTECTAQQYIRYGYIKSIVSFAACKKK